MATPPLLLPHPAQRIRFVETWMAGTSAGTLNWTNQNAGTAAAPTIDDTYLDDNHTGCLRLSTGSTATGRSGSSLSLNSGTLSLRVNGGYGQTEWLVRLNQLSSVSDTFTFQVGFGNVFTSEFTNGSYFLYDTTVSANWVARTALSATRTSVDTGVSVQASQWVKLGIQYSTGSRLFFINGVQVASISTNINTGGSYPAINIRKSVGTTACLVHVNYFLLDHTFNTAR